MKSLIVVGLLLALPVAFAHGAGKEQKCANEAKEALSQRDKITDDSGNIHTYTFWNGAVVGDAAAAVEIDVYKDNSADGTTIYKVELDAEMCTLRSVEVLP